MAVFLGYQLPAVLSSVAYIAELIFFHNPLFFKNQKT